MEEEFAEDGPSAIVTEALDELREGVLAELDLLEQSPPNGSRKFLRSRPNLELSQGHLYLLQGEFQPGLAGRLRRGLENLLGKPKPDLLQEDWRF